MLRRVPFRLFVGARVRMNIAVLTAVS